ncbi:hypothetical protein GCM10018780_74860 [Streptomyces lanatus]|nr:hypothetical protein GCM10018780_74860 [Streptomyces lanatus]
MAAGRDVMVTGGHDVLVAGTGGLPDQLGDGGGHVGTAGHREAASFAEVVLHIYDDQGAAHGRCPSVMDAGVGTVEKVSGPADELPSLETSGAVREGALGEYAGRAHFTPLPGYPSAR